MVTRHCGRKCSVGFQYTWVLSWASTNSPRDGPFASCHIRSFHSRTLGSSTGSPWELARNDSDPLRQSFQEGGLACVFTTTSGDLPHAQAWEALPWGGVLLYVADIISPPPRPHSTSTPRWAKNQGVGAAGVLTCHLCARTKGQVFSHVAVSRCKNSWDHSLGACALVLLQGRAGRRKWMGAGQWGVGGRDSQFLSASLKQGYCYHLGPINMMSIAYQLFNTL